jgi:flagellin
MASTINTNIQSLTAQRNLSMSQSSLTTSMQRLSSGLRINSAKDDAAGLAISDRMTSQIRGLNQAARNANDGISLAQVAEGALNSTSSNLQRIRELAVQAANGTNTAGDRAALQQEVLQLTAEIVRVGEQTEFNGLKLLDGSYTTQQFQVGANANQTIGVSVGSAKASDLGNNRVSTTTGAGIQRAQLGTVIATPPVNGFTGGTLTIAGNGTTAATSALAAGTSAKAVAAAVNGLTSQTGVNATATTTATLSGVTAGAVSFKLTAGNSTAVTISATVSSASDLSAIAQAVNAQSSVTNVTATADKSGNLVFSDNAGNDIKLQNLNLAGVGLTGATLKGADAAATAVTFIVAGTAGDAATVGGQVSFDSASGFTVSATGGTTLLSAASVGSTLSSVAAVDVSTAAGATAALQVVDSALASVSANRATLGAVQNRFQSTIANLQTNSENLSASRSRIQDADFAMETANLSRTQILQQAGTAMVAQANQLPQGVLQLLKG